MNIYTSSYFNTLFIISMSFLSHLDVTYMSHQPQTVFTNVDRLWIT